VKEPNINIERAILSAIIFDPILLDDLQLQASDFYFPFHQKLFTVYKTLEKVGKPIDEDFIKDELTKRGEFDEIALLDVLSANPISNIKAYQENIIEASQDRKFNLEIRKILSSEGSTSEKLFKINVLKDKLGQSSLSSLPPIQNTSDIRAEKPTFFLKDNLPIQKNEVTMITGKGGGGKSFVGIWLSGMLAKKEKLKVFAYLSEDSVGNTKNRLDILRKTTPHLMDFDVWGKDIRPQPFISKSRDGLLKPSEFWYQFTNHFNDYDVILLDPLIAFIADDENSNTEARFLFNLLNEWCVKKNKTIVVIHHHNKNDETRGASAFVDASRLHYSTKKKENNDTSRFLFVEKTNHYAGESEFEIQLFQDFIPEKTKENNKTTQNNKNRVLKNEALDIEIIHTPKEDKEKKAKSVKAAEAKGLDFG